MHADGSGARPVFRGDVSAISWASDGTALAVAGSPNPPADQFFGDQIYLVTLDGSQPRNLSQSQTADTWPAWSPDGKQIAFMRPLAHSFYNAIFLMNVDGSNQHQLTGPNVQVVNLDPSWLPWAPDGRSLLFQETSFGAGTPDPNVAPTTLSLDVIDVDGTNLRRISKPGDNDIFARWSPDGQRILFTKAGVMALRTSAEIPTICVMQADGSNEQCLTDGKSAASSGAWSPDGTEIAYFGLPEHPAGEGTQTTQASVGNLLIMNADGSDAHVIVANVVDSGDLASGLAWRPTGD